MEARVGVTSGTSEFDGERGLVMASPKPTLLAKGSTAGKNREVRYDERGG